MGSRRIVHSASLIRFAPGCFSRLSSACEEPVKLFETRGVAQLAQGLRLDLADALARHVELFSDLFKRPGKTVGQPEAVVQHLTFAVGQRRQDFL